MATNRGPEAPPAAKGPVNISDRQAWRAALDVPRPLLVHLNADTTWLIQIPYPEMASERPPGRSRFNLLLDPWLQGPQSDVASWFSTQWHIIAPSIASLSDLNSALRELEAGSTAALDHLANASNGGDEAGSPSASWFIDAVAISHEFTDHCHRATLEELPKDVPVFATDEAAKLIRSWDHFANVVTTPPFSAASADWQEALSACHPLLPSWLAVGRVVTAGNALYYHSAILVAFETSPSSEKATDVEETGSSEVIVYSPHGIEAQDLACIRASGLRTLALLHGLHDVQIWMTKQLNLGALNGIQAARASRTKYWIATHDEVKRGGGFISWLLQRTAYSLKQAIEWEQLKLAAEETEDRSSDFQFIELGSGDATVLE